MDNRNYKISVCIPVYETEPFLLQCLRSVIKQEYADFEIIVLNDASRGVDSKGRSAKKLIALAQKECNAFRKEKQLPKLKIRFIEHRKNLGIVEVRRSLAYEANGTFVCFIDSDDELEEGALKTFESFFDCDKNPMTAYDIIQGHSRAGAFDNEGNFIPSALKVFDKITIGQLKGHEIFHEWVSEGNITGVLWAKLIKSSILKSAFENIPYSECNMAEDYMISFFVTQLAKTYIGIDANVYRYRITSGISSGRKIDNLKRWQMVCSTSSVFTVISQWLQEHQSDSQITQEEILFIKKRTAYYLANNLKQMKETVIPELQPAARQMLCDYWGEHFVQTVELQTN